MEMDKTLTNLSRVLSELEVGNSINTLVLQRRINWRGVSCD